MLSRDAANNYTEPDGVYANRGGSKDKFCVPLRPVPGCKRALLRGSPAQHQSIFAGQCCTQHMEAAHVLVVIHCD